MTQAPDDKINTRKELVEIVDEKIADGYIELSIGQIQGIIETYKAKFPDAVEFKLYAGHTWDRDEKEDELHLISYRWETDTEYDIRMLKIKQQQELEEKKKEEKRLQAEEQDRKNKEQFDAQLKMLCDPDYVKMQELAKKFGKTIS